MPESMLLQELRVKSWQTETALRCATIICALAPADARRLRRALATPHGDHEFALLLARFFQLDAETRACVIHRMRPALRVKREGTAQA